MTQKYAIFINELGYDDFFIRDWVLNSSIIQEFENKEEAEKAYKNLITKALKEEGFSNYDIGNDQADKEIYQIINIFTEKKLGKIYHSVNDIEFNKLTDDELIELAQAVNLNIYKLALIDENENFYVFWLNKHNKYLKTEFENEIVNGSYENFLTEDPSARELCRLVDFLNEKPPTGALNELSNNPKLLEEALNNQNTVLYQEERLTIREDNHWMWLNSEDGLQDLKSINNFLKEPWFEIRKMRADEIQ